MSMISNLSVLTVTVLLSSWSPKHPVDLKVTAPNGVQRIDQLWLVTFVDEAGREIVVQAKLVSGEFVPLIAADAARLDSIMTAGRSIAKATNIRMRLVRFTSRIDVEDISP
jgi:hypothetical protein